MSNFFVQPLKGEDITICGTGQQTRSFCYVDDRIAGLVHMMNAPAEFTGPVNLGNPVEFTMPDLAENVLRLTGSTSKLTFKPLPQDDPSQRQPDIALAKEKLARQPAVALADGLRETIAYFRKTLAL